MKVAVLKFGGTSVKDLSRLRRAARIISLKKEEGYLPIVVVSAMGSTTDELLRMALELSKHPSKRELDLLLSTGEQLSASLLAIYLNSIGEKAISLNAYQIPIYTDGNYGQAKILEIVEEELKKYLEKGYVVVVPGFQGLKKGTKEITTLGRGGSDTTAVALAYSLGVGYCEIYTDVDGVYTADPEIVSSAQMLETISYEEMIEFAGNGAQVLHPRSVVLAQENSIVLHVRNSYFPEKTGTIVREKNREEIAVVAGVTYTNKEGRITVEGIDFKRFSLSDLLSQLERRDVNINLLAMNKKENSISLTIGKEDFINLVPFIGELSEKRIVERAIFDTQLSRISIIGSGMRDYPGVAYKMISSLWEERIPVQMVSSSDIKVSCFIHDEYLRKAIRAIHSCFELERGPYFGKYEKKEIDG